MDSHLVSRRTVLAGGGAFLTRAALGNSDFEVRRLTDPLTRRSIDWYRSPHHETHHYYFVSPWSPSERRLAFFQFDRTVEKLTARGHYPGSLVTMNADGTSRRTLLGGLKGHYHVGVNQFWAPDGESVYFVDGGTSRLARVGLADQKVQQPNTPVRCDRLSPDGSVLSCGGGGEWGVYRPADNKFKRLVTLERVMALSPNKSQIHKASILQNTRFSPAGDRVMIVHRTLDDPPSVIEIYVYDFHSGQLGYISSNLHHPGWRPDGKAIVFVRWDEQLKMQNLWEVNVETRQERRVFDQHISAVHGSYHPRKLNVVMADCYGGDFGNGLVLVDVEKKKARQLVSIPQGEGAEKYADERFPFRNFGLWFPPRRYLNEPRPVWNSDGSRVLYTSEESGRINLYVADTSDV